MKVLFISNFYPPSKQGLGYMQLCEEVADGLAARGHSVAVLTSTDLDGDEQERPYPVYRQLEIDPDWINGQSTSRQFLFERRRKEALAMSTFSKLIKEFQPDIIFVWHAIGLPKAMLKEAEAVGKPVVVYYLADYQPEIGDEYEDYWRRASHHPLARLTKKPLASLALFMLAREGKPIRLQYQHAICVSGYVRKRLVAGGFIPGSSVVIHNGVDLSQFTSGSPRLVQPQAEKLRLIVAGRILPLKGIHTIVEAFASLADQPEIHKLSLTILGDGPVDYIQNLKKIISNHNLQKVIHFQSPVPRRDMPDVLSRHDGLILASEYDEPLARAIQEAMAMELLVLGTVTGGSGELLVNERTGLVFKAGDPLSLAAQLIRTVQDPDLVTRLRKAGRKEIEENFSIQRTILQVEEYLRACMDS